MPHIRTASLALASSAMLCGCFMLVLGLAPRTVGAATNPFIPKPPAKPVPMYTLFVANFGNSGSSSVVSQPAGIGCTTSCTAKFAAGTRVTLSIRAVPGSTKFLRWGGACSGSGAACTVTLERNTWVNAYFTRSLQTFTVSVSKDGPGTVVSSSITPPAPSSRIDCGSSCTAVFPAKTTVILTAQPAAGYVFSGWGKGCDETISNQTSSTVPPAPANTCRLLLMGNRRVVAVFTQPLITYALLVSYEGKGAVVGDGVECGEKCENVYTAGTELELVAKPEPGYHFVSWKGNCRVDEKLAMEDVKEPSSTCLLTMDQSQEVAALFAPDAATLTVRYEGAGVIYSSDKVITCGQKCSSIFPNNTMVTLIAEPAPGYQFVGWSKNCEVTKVPNQCAVTMSSDKDVSATFAPTQATTFRVYVRNSPGGTITSTPAGINCGKACAADFSAGARVNLLAVPNPGYQISRWYGACTSNDIGCTLIMDSDKDVLVAFVPVKQSTARLSVVPSGTGSGRVTASLGSIDCGKACVEVYTPGLVVRLYAEPAMGSTFAGWSSNCDAVITPTTCDVNMFQDQTVIATFTIGKAKGEVLGAFTQATPPAVLQVNLFSPNTYGRITASAGAIDCGNTCSESYSPGILVSLFAEPARGYVFKGWGGACIGVSGLTCTLVLEHYTLVTVEFSPSTRNGVVLGVSTKVVPPAKPPRQTGEQSSTTNLLKLAKQYPGVALKDRAKQLGNMVRAAKDRRKQLAGLMDKNPAALLQVALPNDLREALPAEVKAETEAWVSIEGELWVLHADDFKRKRSTETYSLKLADGKQVQLNFAGKKPQLLTGSWVRVTGVRLGDKVASPVVDSKYFEVLYSKTDERMDPTMLNKKIAVILMNFQNDTSQPFTVDQVRSLVFGSSTSTNAFYQEASFGQLQLVGKIRPDGDVFGWYTIPYTYANCGEYFNWASAARAAAEATGVDLTGYDNFIYGWNRQISGCPGNAWTWLGSNQAWVQNNFVNGYVIDHELGHDFGLNHANGYYCVNNTGQRVPISDNCQNAEYADPFDTMGQANRHFNNYHKGRLNWLSSANTQTVTTSGIYTVVPVEQASGGIISLRVPRTTVGDYYYLEFRQPFGFDNFAPTDPVVNGVTIRLAEDYDHIGVSHLINATSPTEGAFWNAPLLVGQTFADVAQGIAITLQSVGPVGAQVNVTLTPPTCTHCNPVVDSVYTLSGIPGSSLAYQIRLFNLDGLNCAPVTYAVAPALPGVGWVQAPAAFNLTVAPGQFGVGDFTVTSPGNAQLGYYDFTERVTNTAAPSYSTITHGTYSVIPPDTTPPLITQIIPANGTSLGFGLPVSLSAFVSDCGNGPTAYNGCGVTEEIIRLDGAEVMRCNNFQIRQGQCTYSVNNLQPGSHAVIFSATDQTTPPNTSSATSTLTVGNGTSGVSGIVRLGPVCPVQKYPPDPACAPRPVSLRLYVSSVSAPFTQVTVQSGDDGTYSVALVPGTYQLSSQLAVLEGGLRGEQYPRFETQEVVVQANQFIQHGIIADSGIR